MPTVSSFPPELLRSTKMRYFASLATFGRTAMLVGLTLFASACRTPRSSPTQAPVYSTAIPTRLIVGRSGDFTVTAEHRIVVEDSNFVRELFSTLSRPPTNAFKHYLLIAPYPFIFVDAHGDVCGGFRYSSSSRPDCVFWPCWVERRGDDYVITSDARRGGIVVPGFTEAFRSYKDLTEP